MIPQVLVVHLVVELHLGGLDNRAQQARAAVGRCLLQVGVAAFHVFPEEFGCPIGFAEVVDRRVDVVGQVAFGLAEVLDLGRLAFQSGLENGVHHQVGIGVGSDGAHLDAHAALVADRDADHGAPVHRRRFELVGRFEVRIEAAIGVDAGIEHQAEIVAVSENAVEELIAELAELLFALGIPEQVLAVPC